MGKSSDREILQKAERRFDEGDNLAARRALKALGPDISPEIRSKAEELRRRLRTDLHAIGLAVLSVIAAGVVVYLLYG